MDPVIPDIGGTHPGPRAARGGSDDAEAIRATLGGNRRAFEAVVLRHENAVFGMILRMTASREDAEDLTQETFLRAYRSLGSFDQRRPFRPWLLSIAANATREMARRRGRSLQIFADDNEMELADFPDHRIVPAADAHSERQQRELLHQAVSTLRGESAALYHLHFREQLAVETIAETLGKRPNTIAVALHRLRQNLQRIVHSIVDGEKTP
ncbi:sigma-70 family RNA polymerase sigma factor [bacterium]|nr:sigma-70 family RNA polymerase sigma factor [bacterium]